MLQDLTIAAALLGVLLLSLELGFRGGRRAASERDPGAGAQIGAIQGAILGLLGLLLAFSFSAAGGRFLERQDLIVREANAIGTSFLRADLLDEPHRSELRAALKRYTEHRIEITSGSGRALLASALPEIEQLHARIWSAARAGVAARRDAMMAVLLPVNEVIDLHATRLAASRKRIPTLVLSLLVASSCLALAAIGYGCGLGGRRRAPMTVSLALVIAVALWTTIDLDYPRAGLLRLSDAPLEDLKFDAPRE